jgi:pimeloyl-ACP methyl ester carboxylesterase
VSRTLARLVTGAAGVALALSAGASPPGRGITLASCQLAHPVTSQRVPARCGSLEVPENPAKPEGRRIALRVAVLDADAPAARPDAVFVLAGGPGQSITEVYPQIAPAFDRLRRDRDVVLVDQRGTGGSGKLACPGAERPPGGFEREDAALAAELAACSRSLPADLTRYGTGAFVNDLEAVRAALGYDQVNLVGFSYGTRAALAYARAHPARARTLVLDGVASFEMLVGADFDVDAERALQALFRRCHEDRACQERYPDLERDLRALLARLDARPEKVRVRHPVTAERVDITVDGDAVRQVLLGFLYTAETAALLPPLVAQARQGDLEPLAAQGILVATDIQAGMSRPLQLAVLCAEDVPFYRDPPPGAPPTFLGGGARESMRRLCAAWPRGTVEPGFRDPVTLRVPALLLSGEADPVTPPRWADVAAGSLPASRRVVLAGQGHGVLARGCLPRVVAAFVAAGSADGLDLACADLVRPAPLFLDLQGGAP